MSWLLLLLIIIILISVAGNLNIHKIEEYYESHAFITLLLFCLSFSSPSFLPFHSPPHFLSPLSPDLRSQETKVRKAGGSHRRLNLTTEGPDPRPRCSCCCYYLPLPCPSTQTCLCPPPSSAVQFGHSPDFPPRAFSFSCFPRLSAP